MCQTDTVSVVVHSYGDAGRIPAEAGSEGDSRAVRRRAGRARTRSSSSSGTTPGASTTTFGSSATARWRAGRCRKAFRSSPASSIWPSTSRTTRSTTPTFEGEIPKGNYGAGIGRDLGPRHLRARRGEAERRPDRPPARRAARGHLGARAGQALGRPEELAAHPQARRGRGRSGGKRRYKPMLATLAKELPKGEGWLFEVKWDGYRALAYVRGGEAELVSRNDNDLTERFPTVRRALERSVRTPDCVLDGEVCALDEEGPRHLLGHAAGEGRHALHLRRLRRARGRGQAADRPAAGRAARAARAAARPAERRPFSSRRRSRTARRSTRRRRSSSSRA